MSFVSPAYLLFLMLVPVLIALYFKKSRPMRKVVPNTRLWDQVLRRLSNNSLFHRYRHSLFLALQMIVLLSLVFGLSRPHWRHSLSGRTIIVLDTSASMRATDVSPSRFASARDAALDLVGRVDSGGDVALVTADSQVTLRAPFGTDLGTTIALLKRIEPTDHPGPDTAEVLAVVETLQRQRADRVEIFSDQLSGDDFAQRLKGVGLTVHAVGARGENAAVTRFEIRTTGKSAAPKPGASPAPAVPVADGTSDAVVQVTSFAGEMKGQVEIVQGAFKVAKPFELAKRGDTTVHFEGLKTKDGLVEARLVLAPGTDLLEADNHAYATLGKQAASVLMLGRENSALARVLKTIPGLQLNVIGWQQVGNLTTLPAAELTVAEGVYHPDLLNRNALIMSGPGEPGSPSAPWLEGGSVDEPVPTRFESTHPVLKYLSLKDVSFTRAAILRREPGDVEVLGTNGTALILARSRGAVRHVVCGFDTEATDFSLRVGFPIFVMNALRWIAGSRMEGGAGLKLGEAYPLPAGMSPNTTLTGPDGKAIEWRTPALAETPATPTGGTTTTAGTTAGATSGATVGATAAANLPRPTSATTIPAACFAQVGVYTLTDGPRTVLVPAILASFGESNVAPAQTADVTRTAPASSGDGATPVGLARWLIGLALLVMITEWALYARMGG